MTFEVEMDATEMVAALDGLGAFALPYLTAAAQASAQAIRDEAKARLRRQLGPNATGQTEAGIESRPASDGNGYVVVSSRGWMPMLPKWIERGTRKGDPGSSTQPARPFFDVAASLEKGAHFRRIGEALQDAIDDRGLGT